MEVSGLSQVTWYVSLASQWVSHAENRSKLSPQVQTRGGMALEIRLGSGKALRRDRLVRDQWLRWSLIRLQGSGWSRGSWPRYQIGDGCAGVGVLGRSEEVVILRFSFKGYTFLEAVAHSALRTAHEGLQEVIYVIVK